MRVGLVENPPKRFSSPRSIPKADTGRKVILAPKGTSIFARGRTAVRITVRTLLHLPVYKRGGAKAHLERVPTHAPPGC